MAILKIGYMDLVKLIKVHGFDDFDASVIADYIDENLCCSVEDCTIHKCTELGGVYLEWS